MSLDKAIDHGKEKRKPYRKSKKIDKSCRNHGGCPYCETGRLHSQKRQDPLSSSDKGLDPEDTDSCKETISEI